MSDTDVVVRRLLCRVRSVTPTAIQEPPPYSNGRTSVWYWSLDGVQTTLMFSKLTMEIWCNGRTLPTTVRLMLRYAFCNIGLS